MKAPDSTAEHPALPSDLLISCPPALQQVEARLFILALACLQQDAQQLTFKLPFENLVRDGDADSRYARLEKAQQRLTQPLKYEISQPGKRYSQYIPLFTQMRIDQDTELITGVFNHQLKDYFLELGSRFTTAELEALLMLRP